ncbi:MAG: DUF3180 domain-containing protein [Actinomycetota bacterium]|nr:DUF3180 domain-containing protein [Actinomycetota bacterium]
MIDRQSDGIGLTRWRDLAVVAVVATVLGYLLLRWNYQRLPPMPRLAGLPAAAIGVGEAVFGWGLRNRIHGRGARRVDALAAARAVAAAKATSLAAAAFGGMWFGVIGYVVPLARDVAAAASDRTTAILGLLCALLMLAGGLFLERCCRTPDQPDLDDDRRDSAAE